MIHPSNSEPTVQIMIKTREGTDVLLYLIHSSNRRFEGLKGEITCQSYQLE